MENSFPKIWKIIDIYHKGELKKCILQEIPEHYYDEIINKVIYEIWSDENLFRSMNMLNDLASAEKVKNVYRKCLAQNISVGVFEYKENDENKLVGLNILFRDNIKLKNIINTKSTNFNKIEDYYGTVQNSYAEELIGNEDYLASKILLVCKDYRNIGLGQQLLELRNNIGKKYNFKYTISLFTSSTSQKLAEKVGFTRKRVCNFNDTVDSEKNCLFPSLKDKSGTFMIKYLS